MRPSFLPLVLAIVLAFPLQAAAQTEAPSVATAAPAAAHKGASALTLAEAIKLAFEGNPGLRTAMRDIDIAAGELIQAGTRPNPELSFVSEGLKKEQRTRTIQFSQPLELGGKRAARMAAASLGGDIASADLAGYRTSLRADVVTAFFDVVAAQEGYQLALASQQLAQRVSDAAARRVMAGKVSPVEQTRARVAEASSKIELNQAANDLTLSKRRLAATWGSQTPQFDSVVALEMPAQAVPTSNELNNRLPTAPQTLRARLEVDRQEALTKVERSRRIPDVNLIVGTQRDEQLGQIGPRRTILGLSIPLPLFDRNQGNVLAALRRADKARDELKAVENRLSTEVAEATARLSVAQSELTILRTDILPGALSAYEAASKGFELGKFSFLDVLDAQRTLFQAKTQYVRALAESHRSAADIDRIIGRVESNGTLIAPAISYQETK